MKKENKKLQWEFYKDFQSKANITIYKDFSVSFYVTVGYSEASISMSFKDLINMRDQIDFFIKQKEIEMKTKGLEREQIETMLENEFVLNTDNQFEWACIEEGFELNLENGKYYKVL